MAAGSAATDRRRAGEVATPLRRELGILPLAAIIFFNVSGGPYGVEDAVPSFGPGLALLLLLITPLVYSLPVALAMSELAAVMPDEGGYIVWVERAYGRFWAFQVGWWTWINSFVDVAVYPALFVEYMRFWYPAMTSLERWLSVGAFIVVLTALNIAGVRLVGYAAVALAFAALAPAVCIVVIGAANARVVPWEPFMAPELTLGAGLGLGLAVVMWNYSGWDMPTTTLGETRAPERVFRTASLVALPIITAAYVLPVAVALSASGIDWREWTTGSLPRLGTAIGGAWLGHALAAAALVAAAGLFMSLLLTNSRVPYVLARDGLLPAALGAVHARLGTPWVAIVVSSAIYAALAGFTFLDLIVLNVWLYSLTLIVELAAFVRLRAAGLVPGYGARPGREPVNWTRRVLGGLALVTPPLLLSAVAMATAGTLNTVVGIGAALTGPALYVLLRRRAGPGSPR